MSQAPLGRTVDDEPAHPNGATGAYLLVLQDASSSIFLLPAAGEVVIGRSTEADVHLAAAVPEPLIGPWHLPALREAAPEAPDAGAGGFRPIEEELQELEVRRMLEALEAVGGQQKRAARLRNVNLVGAQT